MTTDVPVLLITFRRPGTTTEVLDALRAAAPSRLFVAGDGPRPDRPDEVRAVVETREVVARGVDWPTELRTRFHDDNLGCRRAVVDAIDWFLGEVGEGIILEDDCVPHPDFFGYCAELLERFRDDERVWCIGGDNSGGVGLPGAASYGFVRNPQIWGWATWARAWARYDRDLAGWAAIRGTPAVRRALPDPLERRVTVETLDRLLEEGVPDTWDYQWIASCLFGGGLCAVPRQNLIRNVGFGPDATHTLEANRRAFAGTGSVLPLVHPRLIAADPRTERELFDRTRGGARLRAERSPSVRLRRALRRLLGGPPLRRPGGRPPEPPAGR